jgi:hypothetical protein
MGIDIESFLEEQKLLKDKQECFFTMKKEEDPNNAGKTIVALVDPKDNTYPHFLEIANKFEKGINGYALSNDQIFFWNDQKIYYINFNETQEEKLQSW